MLIDPLTIINSIFLFVIGCAMGSFLNVLSDRLPQGRSILGRSHCERCHHVLQWYDLLPLVSFFMIYGKCRYCHTRLSWFYPMVELATGIIFVITWYSLPTNGISSINLTSVTLHQTTIISFLYLIVMSALLVIFFADIKYQIIPDSMQAILLVAGVFLRMLTIGFSNDSLVYPLIEGLLVMAPLLLMYVLTKGRGMGFGDVKLAFAIGILLGIKGGLIALYLAFLMGAVVGALLILRKKKKMKSKIAFGPFLVAAIMIVLFFKPQLLVLIQRFWGI